MKHTTLLIIGSILFVIVVGVFCFALGRYASQTKPVSANPSSHAENANNGGSPTISVKDLHQNMLRYNGQTVHLKALVVDFGNAGVLKGTRLDARFEAFGTATNLVEQDVFNHKLETSSPPIDGWIIADDLGSYFTDPFDKHRAFVQNSDNGGIVFLKPATPQIHYHDYVEVTGVYDANSDTLQSVSAITVGHLAPIASANIKPNRTTSSNSLPTYTPINPAHPAGPVGHAGSGMNYKEPLEPRHWTDAETKAYYDKVDPHDPEPPSFYDSHQPDDPTSSSYVKPSDHTNDNSPTVSDAPPAQDSTPQPPATDGTNNP